MTTARLQTEWDRTAAILAWTHNVNCTKKADMISDPSVLNPLRKKAKGPQFSIREMRQAVTGRK
jgi:hypothetical protein